MRANPSSICDGGSEAKWVGLNDRRLIELSLFLTGRVAYLAPGASRSILNLAGPVES
jgi:hypothetical protein